MSKQDAIQVKGRIMESHGDCRYSIKLDTGVEIKAQLSGKLKQAFIKCIPGDEVLVELSPYDLSHGRICRRLNKGGGPRPVINKKRK